MTDKYIGKKYGKWKVVRVGTPDSAGRKRYFCRCVCGNTSHIRATVLVCGDSRGCGSCAQRGNTKGRKHGHMTGARKGKTTRTYMSWKNMTQRCTNPKNPGYADYGGRGIKVCKRWQGSGGFERFLEDLGERPADRSLGRKRNMRGYTPSNVRWETNEQQHNNKRSSRYFTVNGVKRTIAQWARQTGLDWKTLSYRIDKGWASTRVLKR